MLLVLVLVWQFLPGTETEVPNPGENYVQTQQHAEPTLSEAEEKENAGQTSVLELTESISEENNSRPDENESYTSKEDVALYIHLYGHLPPNFIKKKDAEAAGWSGGSLENVLPGMCIGGDRFGNYEGLLPKANGRKWTECDINTLGAKSRGAERIVFSNDGLIYYTSDHYESFELLYD